MDAIADTAYPGMMTGSDARLIRYIEAALVAGAATMLGAAWLLGMLR